MRCTHEYYHWSCSLRSALHNVQGSNLPRVSKARAGVIWAGLWHAPCLAENVLFSYQRLFVRALAGAAAVRLCLINTLIGPQIQAVYVYISSFNEHLITDGFHLKEKWAKRNGCASLVISHFHPKEFQVRSPRFVQKGIERFGAANGFLVPY